MTGKENLSKLHPDSSLPGSCGTAWYRYQEGQGFQDPKSLKLQSLRLFIQVFLERFLFFSLESQE